MKTSLYKFLMFSNLITSYVAKKGQLGNRQTEGKNLVWFGKIERKSAKLTITTFTYCSSSELFYTFNRSTSPV
jgi:hypothetical protein